SILPKTFPNLPKTKREYIMSRSILRKNVEIQPRFVEIGRCYKGTPKGTSKRGYAGGDDYNSSYLRFEPSDRLKFHPASSNQYENMHAELKARWETLIKDGRVKIRFPLPSVDENFVWSNKVIKAIANTEKTFRECDGVTCTKWVESIPHPTKTNQTLPKFVKGSKPCSAVEGKECPEGCQAKGLLKFMVPDLYPGGIIILPLNSPVDIGAIAGYLKPFENIDLSAIPFSLFRKASPVSWEEKGEIKTKAENWGLHLEIDPQMSMLMMASKKRQFIGELQGQPKLLSQPIAALPPARTETLPTFGKSDDGYQFVARMQSAIQLGSTAELDAAVDDAMDLVHSGLYEFKSGVAFIDYEYKRALQAISDRSLPSEDPRLSLVRKLFALARDLGYTDGNEFKTLVKTALKVESFNDIPQGQLPGIIQILQSFSGHQLSDRAELDKSVFDALTKI
ncbi:MAG: hypothetical protein ACRC4J_00835, partial [Cetobacterium sp.]